MTAPRLYFDTSAIVPAFIREPATERILSFLSERGGEPLALSHWSLTEFESAVSLKLRTGAITSGILQATLAEWQGFLASIRLLEVNERAFLDAALFCRRHELALRAGDALHLAVARAHGCTLLTLDERLAKAAPELGVPVLVI